MVLLLLMLLVPCKISFAVTDLTVETTKQPKDRVEVAWNVVDGATQYQVLMSEGNKDNYKVKATLSSENVGANAYAEEIAMERLSATIGSISKKKQYYFLVQALSADGAVIAQDTTDLYNGDIVSTTKQKYSYADMKKDIKQLEKKYADYIEVNIIGTTVDKRNIYDVILGNPNAEKCVVFQASIHAREYMTSQLVMEQMEYYLDNYNKKYDGKTYKKIFDEVCVHVVAMSNPDGVTISQQGFGGIRSTVLRKKLKKMRGANNTTVWKANARGVDLNRQFNYRFKYVKKWKKGSYAMYGGRNPVSENESKSLVKLVNDVNPKAVVNYHAMGNVIYCNYGASKKMQKKVYQLSGEIRSLTGYSYMGLDQTPGFANWLVCKKGIPSCTVEIGMHTTPVPISQFKTVWKQNKNVMVAVAKMYD